MEEQRTDLIGVVIRGSNFDRRGEIEDDGVLLLFVLSSEPGILYGVADLDGKVGLGLGEGFGGVLELPFSFVPSSDSFVDESSDNFDVLDGEMDSFRFRVAEYLISEDGGGCVVHVEDDGFRAFDGLECTSNELLSGGSEDLCTT